MENSAKNASLFLILQVLEVIGWDRRSRMLHSEISPLRLIDRWQELLLICKVHLDRAAESLGLYSQTQCTAVGVCP